MFRLGKGIVIGALLCFLTASPVYAYMSNSPIRKLGRGVANMATGWLELFAQPIMESERSGTFSALTVGVGRGCAYGVRRTLVGVLETVTFPFPGPTVEYRPIIEPEFVVLRDANSL